MEKFKKILRWVLGVILLLLGLMGLVEFILHGYNPQDERVLTYSSEFQNLFNALMLSYIGVAIRVFHIIIGVLLCTKKYWWIALLLHLPFAFNIFLTHIFYDIPTNQVVFFAVGMFVSIATFLLVFLERKRFKTLVMN